MKNRYKEDICKIGASVEGLISSNFLSLYPYDFKDNESQALASKGNLKDRQLNVDNSMKYEKCLQNSLDKRVFGKISPLKLKEGNVTVNWNTCHRVLRDFIASDSNIVRFSDYEVVLAGSISIACNGIKIEKVKCHVKEDWYKFYQNNSQKAFVNACRCLCIRKKFKVSV